MRKQTSVDITYTRDGFPETVRDAFGLVTRIACDACNRRTETTDPSGAKPLSTLKYLYERDGRTAGRSVDGKVQQYRYDARDQLVAVLDADNRLTEAYVYDPAGNILKKTVNGTVTEYAYDAANQLVSSVEDGILTTDYRYDAAGRLAEESGKTYKYGWLDKVLEVTLNGKTAAAFSYHAGGQLAEAEYKDKTETFLWDGLALIRRGKSEYLNEPHAGGGAPVLAGNDVLFNDQLGSTLGAAGADGFKPVARTAFGETAGDGITADEFFTGKPRVADLGYAFLLRNYRPEHGKWQTADPLGYPDGWNNLAYVNNRVSSAVDLMGAVTISTLLDALNHYAWGAGTEALIASSVILQSTSTSGYAGQLLAVEALLAAQPYDVDSGHISYSDNFFWNQGYALHSIPFFGGIPDRLETNFICQVLRLFAITCFGQPNTNMNDEGRWTVWKSSNNLRYTRANICAWFAVFFGVAVVAMTMCVSCGPQNFVGNEFKWIHAVIPGLGELIQEEMEWYRVYPLTDEQLAKILSMRFSEQGYSEWKPFSQRITLGIEKPSYRLDGTATPTQVCYKDGSTIPWNMIAIFVEVEKKRLILLYGITYGR